MTAKLLLIASLAACSSTAKPAQPDWPYDPVPSDPQRTGDAAKGYDYLVNGGYISCGLPKSLYDKVYGPAAAEDRLPGRTGANATLPYYYSAAKSSEGVDIVSANCLTCHAAKLDGKLVVGLGAHDRDFTVTQAGQVGGVGDLITDPTEHAEWERFNARVQAIGPYTQMLTVGVNPADNLTAVLMAHRDPATLAWSDTAMLDLPPAVAAPVDVPPWWRMSKKSAMFYSASGRGDHARIEMAASLLCSDTVAEATAIDAAFVDVRAYIETLPAPAWPATVDAPLAAAGQGIYEEHCASCHGTYGDHATFGNQLVPLADIGTDDVLARGASQFADRFVAWFAASFWGQMSRIVPFEGYIAPPLDGIWASAPYFHNGSVPTLEGVIDPTKRPTYWTRTFDSADYNYASLGWNFTVVDHGQDAEPTAAKKKLIYDTTKPGYGNGGHTFGSDLSHDQVFALIEYLKSL